MIVRSFPLGLHSVAAKNETREDFIRGFLPLTAHNPVNQTLQSQILALTSINMLNYLFFFLFIALGLGAPHTDPPKLADATSPAPTTTQAAPTDVVEIEAINNLPSTSVFCGMQGE